MPHLKKKLKKREWEKKKEEKDVLLAILQYQIMSTLKKT